MKCLHTEGRREGRTDGHAHSNTPSAFQPRGKKTEDHQAYKDFRKNLSKQKYRAKRTYYRKLLNEADSNGDKSATWDVINKVGHFQQHNCSNSRD